MMEPRLGPSPLRPLRVYGKSPAGPVVQSKFPIPSMAIQLKPEATPYELHHVLLSDDDDFDDDMVEAFEFAAGDDDDSDHDVEFESRDAAEHVFSRIQEEDSCSQGGLSAAGDDLGSQGLGIGNKSISGKKGRKAATPEKRRRRQEEVNRAVQQCRMKRKAMLSDMRSELEQLQATYKRLKLRSENLDANMEWPLFEPKPYPPELESRRHTKRGTRYKAESEEERRERVRQQNNQAQYRKALRNKCDEDNMKNEIEFLKKTNATMRSFIHHHLKSKRIHSENNFL